MSDEKKNQNLAFWESVARVPKQFLKQIGGGRLKGMTDISPIYRIWSLTNEFGMCGVGWKYKITEKWQELGTDGQVLCFATVDLYIKSGGEWSEPIPGIGGSMMVAKEAAGLRCNDEAYKMAVTDALSVACKALGIAADIYLGLWDGSKYKDEQPKLDPKKYEGKDDAEVEEQAGLTLGPPDVPGNKCPECGTTGVHHSPKCPRNPKNQTREK